MSNHTDDMGMTCAECESFARVFEDHGKYRKAANLWRDAAELAWDESLRDQYIAKAKACDEMARPREFSADVRR